MVHTTERVLRWNFVKFKPKTEIFLSNHVSNFRVFSARACRDEIKIKFLGVFQTFGIVVQKATSTLFSDGINFYSIQYFVYPPLALITA